MRGILKKHACQRLIDSFDDRKLNYEENTYLRKTNMYRLISTSYLLCSNVILRYTFLY